VAQESQLVRREENRLGRRPLFAHGRTLAFLSERINWRVALRALDGLPTPPYDGPHDLADPPRHRAGAHAAGEIGLRAPAPQPLARLHRRQPALGPRPLVGEVLEAVLLRLRACIDRR